MKDTKTLINKIRTILGVDIKLATMELENGVSIEAEVFEPNAEVFIISEEGKVALPVGEYVTIEGQVITIVEEGIIDRIADKEAEVEVVEEEVEEIVEELEVEEVQEEEVQVEFVSMEDFNREIDTLKKMIEELAKAKLSVDEELEVVEEVELSKTIVHTPDNKVEKTIPVFKNNNNRKSVQNRVFDAINK